MKNATKTAIPNLINRYPILFPCTKELKEAMATIFATYREGGKLICCGNGGSAADSEHIVGELMKGFLKPRKLGADMKAKFDAVCPESSDYFMKNLQGALPAISLVNQVALGTAFANDQAPDLVFAQQILGLGYPEDTLLAISTSGNSTNVIYALDMARAKGMKTIALTGKSGGKIAEKHLADVIIRVPEEETYKIQELHLPVYHMLCIAAEEEFFGE
ncbi:MAG: SIS domain-containing protein [Selenomonadaceae bacterium]|nr:SIS domain-containing protein [Selenomonadaceae bacterium]